MVVEVTNTPDARYPGDWQVMDGRLCWSRHTTKEEAEAEAIKYRHILTLGKRVEELLSDVRDRIMKEFNLSNVDADKAIQEYLN